MRAALSADLYLPMAKTHEIPILCNNVDTKETPPRGKYSSAAQVANLRNAETSLHTSRPGGLIYLDLRSYFLFIRRLPWNARVQ